jgi:uncharacterized membrane protein
LCIKGKCVATIQNHEKKAKRKSLHIGKTLIYIGGLIIEILPIIPIFYEYLQIPSFKPRKSMVMPTALN